MRAVVAVLLLAAGVAACGEAKPAREGGGRPTEIPTGSGLVSGTEGKWYILRQEETQPPAEEAAASQ